MPVRGHQPISINKFGGLYARGGNDSCPVDHFTDLLNTEPSQSETGWNTRDGFDLSLTIGSVLRGYVYRIFGQPDRLLVLNSSGSIYDSTNLSTPILTITGMTDFAFANMFGRAYISPSNGVTGLPGESLYVYTGSGLARAAAGTAPSGSSFTAANTGAAGHVEAGFHLFAVVYETNTGYLTQPGPNTFASVTAPGSQGVLITNIPVGPSNIVARRIIATKIITSYTNNQFGYQYFFVPNGRLGNNTDTSFSVSFFDADLLNDASYLFDLFATIPAGVHLSAFHGRLISTGENANPSVVRVSSIGQPEAFNQVSGLMIIDPANTSSGVTNAQEYRDNLYLFKKTRSYSTTDNGSDASTWNTITIDEGLGADVNSVGTVLDTGGTNVEAVLIANQLGLCSFTGKFEAPELSWKIRDLWKRINLKYFYKVQVAINSLNQRVYIAVPLDTATAPSHILMMDYSNVSPSMFVSSYMQVRWSIWTLANSCTPDSVVIQFNSSTETAELKVGCSGGNVYVLTPEKLDDFGFAIPTPFIQTALLPDKDDISGINHFTGARLRIVGDGILTSTFISQDNALTSSLQDITLDDVPGNPYFALGDFMASKAMLKISLAAFSEWFELNEIKVFIKPVWTSLPNG